MKKMSKRVLAMALALMMVISGLNPVSAYAQEGSPEPLSEWETTIENATTLALDTEAPAGADEDGNAWFSFTPEETAGYKFISYLNEGWDNVGRLYDADGNELIYNDDAENHVECEFGFEIALKAGKTYYLEVGGNNGYGSCCVMVSKMEPTYIMALESGDRTCATVNVPYEGRTELEVVLDGYENIRFEWQYENGEGPQIDDVNTTNICRVNGTIDIPLVYYCYIYQGEECIDSIVFYLSLDTGLVVDAESENVDVVYGEDTTKTLTVTATGGVGEYSYTWYMYNKATQQDECIEEATTGAYEITVDENMSDTYRCEVSDGVGTPVIKYFYVNVDTGLKIEDYNSEVELSIGGETTITVSATSNMDTINYQWYQMGVVTPEDGEPYEDYVIMEGKTSESLTLTGAAEMPKYYKCVVSDAFRNEEASFSIVLDTGLSVDENETIEVTAEDTSVVLTVNATGQGELTYSWMACWENGNEILVNYGVDVTEYTLQISQDMADWYRCDVRDTLGGIKSKNFTISIDSGLEIENEDDNITVPYGQTVDLTVNATGGIGELTYTWEYYGEVETEGGTEWDYIAIDGANDSTYKISGTANMPTDIRCTVSDGYTEKYAFFYLTLDTGLTLDTDYRTIKLGYDETKTLNVGAIGGAGALNYQWYYGGMIETENGIEWDWIRIPGATSSNYVVSRVILENLCEGGANQLKCRVSDGVITKACDYDITIDSGIILDKTYDNITIDVGDTKVLSVSAIGGLDELTYTWYYYTEEDEDGDSERILIKSGSDNTCEITGAIDMPLQYECVVSDGVASQGCDFYIELDSGLQISTTTQDVKLLPEESLTLEVQATGGTGNYTYQWYYWGLVYDEDEDDYYYGEIRMNGKTNASLYVENPDAEIKEYRCMVKDGISTRTINFYITVVELEENEFDFTNGCVIQGDAEGYAISKWYRVQFDEAKGYHFYSSSEGDADPRLRIYNEQLEQLVNADDIPEITLHFDTNVVFKADTVYYMELYAYQGYTADITVNVEELTGLAVSADGNTEVGITYGDTADLKVSAISGVGNVQYQWYYLDVDTEEEVLIAGATTATYRVDSTQNSAYTYVCRVTDGVDTQSVRFEVWVESGIEVECENNSPVIPLGQTIEVTVTATGSNYIEENGGSYSYQWYWWDDEQERRIAIPGATTDTLSLTADENLKAWYVCIVSDGYATEGCPIWPTVDTGLKIYGTSEYLEMAYGETATLSTTVTGGVGELTYTWSKSVYVGDGVEGGVRDVIIEGATGSTYDLYADENASDTYYCTITDGYNTVYKQFNINYLGTIRVLEEVADISLSQTSMVYTGAALKPEPIVKDGNTTLVKGTHYTVEWSNNINAGKNTATVTIKGIGKYKGTVQKPFTITAASIKGATVSASTVTYTGAEQKPTVTVTLNGKTLANSNYTVSYSNNVNAGIAIITVTGKGNYTGTATGKFTINKASINGAVVSAANTVYTGTAQNPAVTVTLGGKALASSNYTVSYSNNVGTGTAIVTVTGKGNYTGTATGKFTISTASIANATVTVKDVSYKGKAVKPAVTVKIGNLTLKEGTDYTVKYSNNSKIGTAKVTVTGIGNYAGTKEASFKIKKGASITVGAYKYTITGNSTVAFAGIKKDTTKKVTVVATVKYAGKTFKVTSIADNALKGKKKVTQVTIGKNVTTIGKSAFEGCTKLSKVTIGAKVTKIGDKAFKKCTALKSITIPSKVTTIGKEAFSGAKNLKTITVKATKIKSVGKNAFKSINKKATIKVPSKQLKKYKTLLKKGQAKTVKIKK